MKIAAIIMVKNESKRIHVTVNSVQQQLDGIVLYDTGSEDDTIDIVEKTSKLPVHVKRGKFVDFSTSSQELLDWANECADTYGYDYFVMLDANDEYVGNRPTIADNARAFYVERRLKYGPHDALSYWYIKVIKAGLDAHYEGRVHEALILDRTLKIERLHDFYIFQDRTKDDDKTIKRMVKDVDILKEDLETNKDDPRSLFYLAQTYACLGKEVEAYQYYSKRVACVSGFEEERFHSLLKCGELSEKLQMNWDVSFDWYIKAFYCEQRVEPLVAIAEKYRKLQQYLLAYSFAKLACDLPYPKNAYLFVELKPYEYTRWHVLSIVAYYAAKLLNSKEIAKVGEDACVKAIEVGYNKELDESNLVFYLV